MPVTVYRSTDTGAPVLTGTAGSLIGLLDACLVNGYTGRTAAGWTKPYTATNAGAYRNAAAGGTNHYWSINDNSPNATAAGREASIRGYETLTAWATGTGPFPTTTQLSAGIIIRKSATADATARPWIVVADQFTCYLFTFTSDFSGYSGTAFGDYFSLKTGDGYRSFIIGRETANTPADATDRLDDLNAAASTAATLVGHYSPRHYVGQIQSAVALGKHGDVLKGGNSSVVGGFGIVAYPNPSNGALMLSQVWLNEDQGTQMVVVGRLRGFWQFLHPAASNVNDGDTFAGTGDLAGKTFLVIKPTAEGTGLYVIETSNTWESN